MNLNNILNDRAELIEILTDWDSGQASTADTFYRLRIDPPRSATPEIQRGFLLFLCHYFYVGLG